MAKRGKKTTNDFGFGPPHVEMPSAARKACREYSTAAFRNKKALSASDECGCYHCGRVYHPQEIKTWVGKEGEEALCPYCGIDAVIPSSSLSKWTFLPILGFLQFGLPFARPLLRKTKRGKTSVS